MKKYALWALVASLPFILAPTPGDVGGCGQAAEELDPPTFYASKAQLYCDACRACAYSSTICEEACARRDYRQDQFPEGCIPVVHDGVVCLRALSHSSCEQFEEYLRDDAPAVPSECNFCPVRQP